MNGLRYHLLLLTIKATVLFVKVSNLFYKYPVHLCLHKTVGFINAGKDMPKGGPPPLLKKGIKRNKVSDLFLLNNKYIKTIWCGNPSLESGIAWH